MLRMRKIEEVLNPFYQMKDPWLAIVLHKTGWEASLFCILYLICFFKTNGKKCCLEKKKGKQPSGTLMEEQLLHIQAVTSFGRMVCSTIAQINYTWHEALLDSGSNISSISVDLVKSLTLSTSLATLIQVIFGKLEAKDILVSQTCTLYIHPCTIHFSFLLHLIAPAVSNYVRLWLVCKEWRSITFRYTLSNVVSSGSSPTYFTSPQR